jgi:ABC-type glycerol-3-phosphate transport system substrate-binding protein
MRPKRLAFIMSALFTLVVLLLSACGGAFSAESNAPIHLTYWYTGTQAQSGPVADLIKQFELAYPNISVTPQYMAHDQEYNAFVSAAQSGTAPDVISSDAQWALELGSKQLVLDLSALAGSVSDFDKTRIAYDQNSSSLFGLPQTSDLLVLYYNKALLTAKNITEPKTMQDFDAANKALTSGSTFGWEYPGDNATAQVFLYAFGGGLADLVRGALTVTISTPDSIAGLNFLKQELKYSPPVDFTNGSTTALADFESGKVAMYIGHSDSYKDILTGSAFSGNANLGIAPVPQDKTQGNIPRSPLVGQDLVMYAQSKHQAAAFAFLTFMSSETSQVYMFQKTGLLPTRGSAEADAALLSNQDFKSLITALNSTEQTLPVTKLGAAFTDPSSGLDDNLQKFLTGLKTVQAATSALATTYQSLVTQALQP